MRLLHSVVNIAPMNAYRHFIATKCPIIYSHCTQIAKLYP
jgi:hypothetical protein